MQSRTATYCTAPIWPLSVSVVLLLPEQTGTEPATLPPSLAGSTVMVAPKRVGFGARPALHHRPVVGRLRQVGDRQARGGVGNVGRIGEVRGRRGLPLAPRSHLPAQRQRGAVAARKYGGTEPATLPPTLAGLTVTVATEELTGASTPLCTTAR